jgi:hypothetical protein
VKTAFVQAMNEMIEDKDEVISEYKQIIRMLTDISALDSEAKQQAGEVDVVAELIRKCVAENAASMQANAEAVWCCESTGDGIGGSRPVTSRPFYECKSGK